MKHLILLFLAAAAVCLTACAQKKQTAKPANHKVLVAYFSATGTTKAVAGKIAAATGGTLHEIATAKPYTAADLDWRNDKSRSSVEMHSATARPVLKTKKFNASTYDVIYIGFPIWWDLAPRAVNTFIESASLNGKKVILFATSGGSTINNSAKELKKAYPAINWGGAALLNSPSQSEITKFVQGK